MLYLQNTLSLNYFTIFLGFGPANYQNKDTAIARANEKAQLGLFQHLNQNQNKRCHSR
ncbi:hypothetical protein STRDD11_02723 [Streptococcus sp. DD11]|nr:hypothetical protein STRDD11_02723 [Streptococcus sp. DD11]